MLHRDVKDENVVIDERFRVKLIDFGSACDLPKDEESSFANFFGTLDYCSPEVLQGNRYRGPELEAWTLGVLMYTMLFAEMPFDGVEDTVKCRYF